MTTTRINGIKANLETLTTEELHNNVQYAEERLTEVLDNLFDLNSELFKRGVAITLELEV